MRVAKKDKPWVFSAKLINTGSRTYCQMTVSCKRCTDNVLIYGIPNHLLVTKKVLPHLAAIASFKPLLIDLQLFRIKFHIKNTKERENKKEAYSFLSGQKLMSQK